MTDINIKFNILEKYFNLLRKNRILIKDTKLNNTVNDLLDEINKIIIKKKNDLKIIQNKNDFILNSKKESQVNNFDKKTDIDKIKSQNYNLYKIIDNIKSNYSINNYNTIFDTEQTKLNNLLQEFAILKKKLTDIDNINNINDNKCNNIQNDSVDLNESNTTNYLIFLKNKQKNKQKNSERLKFLNNNILKLKKSLSLLIEDRDETEKQLLLDLEKNNNYYNNKIEYSGDNLSKNRIKTCKEYKQNMLKSEIEINKSKFNEQIIDLEKKILNYENDKLIKIDLDDTFKKNINNQPIIEENINTDEIINELNTISINIENSKKESIIIKKNKQNCDSNNQKKIIMEINPYLKMIKDNDSKKDILETQKYTVNEIDNTIYNKNLNRINKLNLEISELDAKFNNIKNNIKLLYKN